MIYFLFELFQADKAQVSLETWYDIWNWQYIALIHVSHKCNICIPIF